MRTLHRPVWEGVIHSLSSIFDEGRPADKVIQFQLKNNRKWGSQDRRLFAECVYDLVRWWRKLLFVCDVAWPVDDIWLGGQPRVNERALEAWCLLNDVELGKGIARSFAAGAALKPIWNDPTLPRAVRQSLPEWLDSWAYSQLGESWNEVSVVLNSSAPVFLRANRLKTTPEELVRKLKSEQIESETVGSDGVRLIKRANVFLTKAFHAGLFEVQDLNSQRVAPALGVEPGMRVVDACAGAGGKSLHLAALMKNKGKIIAMDVHEKKLEQLRLRSTRAGATLIETRLIENSKSLKRLENTADRLLLDVPCSGLGVLRRNPDSKWRLTLEEVERLQKLQAEILQGYVSMLKRDGVLVYATCSIMPAENSSQVQKFLASNSSGFVLCQEEALWPQVDGPDGFYVASLKRLGS